MRIKEAAKKLKLYIDLMYLHDVDEDEIKQFSKFKISLESSGFGLKQLLTLCQLGKCDLSDEKQTLLYDLLETGSFPELNQKLLATPKGVLSIMNLPGLGPKKVKLIWKDLKVEDLETLKLKCLSGELSDAKGFGKKTEVNILSSLEYVLGNQSKLLMSEGELFSESVIRELLDFIPDLEIEVVGDLKRNLNVISKLELAVSKENRKTVFNILDGHDLFEKDEELSSMHLWRGFLIDVHCPIEVISLNENKGLHLLKLNSSEKYLSSLTIDSKVSADSELALYQSMGINFVPAEMREFQNIELLNSKKFDYHKVVQLSDIKGCLHNHSVYSDGQNTISEMAAACKQLGLTYFGISDHSKTASYAGGLYERDIEKQHAEIDDWNNRSAEFKIFKGIESDILNDGRLDYDDSVLSSFDFIVSSIHSNLSMNKETATNRLIKAIENPYTTILGHPTGRLLLKRKGYDVDHDKIIDACAANNVCIEINSNPWRLDIDWVYVRQAASKGVLLSVNPDAHEVDGIHDMQYGVKIARKAGLYPEQILNCMSLDDVLIHFSQI